MKKTVLTFGLISGAVSAGTMLAVLPFVDSIGFKKGDILGYTTIVLSALLIFFGIRSFRDNNGGSLTFGRGFAVGILITLISSACYVATWELIYYKLQPGFAPARYLSGMAQRGAWAAHERKRRSIKRFGRLGTSNKCMTSRSIILG